jgi:YidC/Oxa1 family membrane protein insertase
MNLLAPELAKIKKNGASKEEQARLQMELYKKHNTNPFSGCLLVLIQIPIIFALYFVFLEGIKFDGTLLYSFIQAPEVVNMNFMGIIDLGQKSLLLALIAGASQFFQAYYMPKPAVSSNKDGSFQETFAKSMNTQMKYVFPVVVAFIAYTISGAVALYWITSNVFAIGQQIYANRQKNKELVEQRMKMAKDEINHWKDYKYVVVNKEVESCFEQITKIIRIERELRSTFN